MPVIDRAAIERIAARYEGRWSQGYARGKLRSDPVYGAAWAAVAASPWPILDLGCGLGLFECYAREAGGTMPLLGYDFDERKIAQARRATASYGGIHFQTADALAASGHRGNVLLLDVLQYLSAAAQQALLAQVIPMVAPGGVCVIRATLRDGSWRFRLTQLLEWWIRAIGWMRVAGRHFPSEAELVAPFRRHGFAGAQDANWGGTPFNSHVFVFRAPPASV